MIYKDYEDNNKIKKVKNMEVYVSVNVDVSNIETVSMAYSIEKDVAQRISEILSENGYEVADSYEVFRNDNGCIIDPEDDKHDGDM